jgi:hypothetical protein
MRSTLTRPMIDAPSADSGAMFRLIHPRVGVVAWHARRAAVFVYSTLTVSCISGTAVLHGSFRTYASLLAIAGFLASGYAASVRYKQIATELSTCLTAQAEIERRTEVERRLAASSEKIWLALDEMIARPKVTSSPRELRQLASLVLMAAKDGSGKFYSEGCSTRSVLYSLSRDGTTLKRYDHEGWEGRADEPRMNFEDKEEDKDREAVRIARGNEAVLVGYIDDPDRSYKCLAAVPVRVGGTSFGLLAVDSDKPLSLVELDLQYLITIARYLAAALAWMGDDRSDFLGHTESPVSHGPTGPPSQRTSDDTTGRLESNNG